MHIIILVDSAPFYFLLNTEMRRNSSSTSFRRSKEKEVSDDSGDSKTPSAVTRRQAVGYLSKRDEERYRSYVANRKKAMQNDIVAGVGDRDKRNRVPRSISEKKSNGISQYLKK